MLQNVEGKGVAGRVILVTRGGMWVYRGIVGSMISHCLDDGIWSEADSVVPDTVGYQCLKASGLHRFVRIPEFHGVCSALIFKEADNAPFAGFIDSEIGGKGTSP